MSASEKKWSDGRLKLEASPTQSFGSHAEGSSRHLFVSDALRDQAYGDFPLPIGEQQTISQPYIVAEMTQALQPGKDDRILEIGTGSGYQAAILAEIVFRVYTIEKIYPLYTKYPQAF